MTIKEQLLIYKNEKLNHTADDYMKFFLNIRSAFVQKRNYRMDR